MATILDSEPAEWASSSSSESDWDSGDDLSEYSDTRVEDEDWERAEGDFTKHFNRLRQHVAQQRQPANGPTTRDRATDQLAALAKYSSKIAKIDVPYMMGVGVNRKGPSSYANMKDRADRATTEQVLDPRTRTILLKMVGRGLIDEVNGCVSTGKEANVYHALTPEKAHLALKIYKTSILVFKDRDKYVSGEHRFRRGYSRHNPRKMVRLWAEKEMRNLKRLRAAGLHAPEPFEVRENVLVMSFLGSPEGWASPRLKDAELPADAAAPLYEELLLGVRTLFHRCRLVHADLSEYNILYHEDHLYIIDVSQSVEHDHPSAFDFLRNDLKNVEEFFARRGVRCLGLRRAFEFVTRDQLPAVELLIQEAPPAIDPPPSSPPPTDAQPPADVPPPETDLHALSVLRAWLAEPADEADARDDGQEDAVFLRAHIPRSLNEVFDPERDAAALARGRIGAWCMPMRWGWCRVRPPRTSLLKPNPAKAKAVCGSEGEGVVQKEKEEEDGAGEDGDEGEDGSGSDDDEDEDEDAEDGEGAFQERKPRGHRHEDRDAKKVIPFSDSDPHSWFFSISPFQSILVADRFLCGCQERKKAVKAEAKERQEAQDA
ncbi:Serine/threonine-protein kinase RIO1 [Mycena venus]|uniref:Serine/threonine-protein kinase RIO1 n=1 Tax=Mycena venus TaxID=2733690 RepID=A0A8H6YVP0_9AGAR|nr:Serine/threonine-protein kinase RIO1 [Mycena venus]